MAFATQGYAIHGDIEIPNEPIRPPGIDNTVPAGSLAEIISRRRLGQGVDTVIHLDTLSSSALLVEHFGGDRAVCHGIIINGLDDLKTRWEASGGITMHTSCDGVYFPFGNAYHVSQGYFIDEDKAYLGYLHTHSFGYCFPIMPETTAPLTEMKKIAKRIGLYTPNFLILQNGHYYSFLRSFFMASSMEFVAVKDLERGFYAMPLNDRVH